MSTIQSDVATRRQIRTALCHKIIEAQENVAYWTRQKILRTQPTAAVQAGARVLAWQHQLKTLKADLAAHDAAQ